MGCGNKGTFSHIPSLRQWAVLVVHNENVSTISETPLGRFISAWFKILHCEVLNLWLRPVGGHGKWDGKYPFRENSDNIGDGPVAILTRASIRSSKARDFWKYVAPVSAEMINTPGHLYYLGMGELPWIRQATFSIWNSMDAMKGFAYGKQNHVEVIRRTHKEGWYSEDMYTRFSVVASSGKICGENPLEGKL